MDDRAILNINIVANTNGVNITANYGIEPHTAIITHYYVTYNGGVFGYKSILADGRNLGFGTWDLECIS
jgi:hypothetical protein